MSNTLGVYNPIFYAQEALIQLESALGMAGRVHRGIEAERNSFGKGDTIKIRRPSTFTAQDAPSSAQDLNTETVTMTLSNWKEVKFALTDKELAYTSERIIEDHIRPAAYALADNIDQALCGLYTDIPWVYDLNATPGSVVTDVTGPRKLLFDNKVPMKDMSLMHYLVDGSAEAGLLGNSAFGQWQGAGPEGVRTQMSGAMGSRFGLNFFANQNVKTHTAGTIDDTALLVVGETAKGLKVITLDAADAGVAGTLVPGDTFVIAGNTQRYAVTALNTASGNAFTAVAFTPALAATAANDAVVTVDATSSQVQNMAFHKNAFALAMAPLSEIGNGIGARIATINDPVSNLAIRSRIYYDGDNSKVNIALDVLYGYTTLDPNLAVRARD